MRKPDKYNVGDAVTIKGIVFQDRVNIDGTVQCSFNAPNNALNKMKVTFCVAVDDIMSHTPLPRPLQVGDIVKYKVDFANDTHHEILCVYNDELWIKPVGGKHCYTAHINSVVRV